MVDTDGRFNFSFNVPIGQASMTFRFSVTSNGNNASDIVKYEIPGEQSTECAGIEGTFDTGAFDASDLGGLNPKGFSGSRFTKKSTSASSD